MKLTQRRGLIGIVLVFLVSASSCNLAGLRRPTATPAPTLQPGDSVRTLSVNGLNREYALHIPPGRDRSQALPVVFVFHGWGELFSTMPATVGLDEIADAAGFLVVYPGGTDLSWNAGICCGPAVTNNVDEAVFVRQILADLETIARIDAKRIYATGYSNGAMLSYRLACEMSETFAAIAPVAGVLAHSPCQPAQPVSVLHIHGLDDTSVPYAGGGEAAPGGLPPVEQGIDTWVQLNGCTTPAQVDRAGASPTTHTVYSDCQAGTTVEVYAIEGLDHSWPAESFLPVSEVIWEFFATHPKP